MFRLTRAEVESLNRSQIVTGSQKHDPRFPPYGFTEHGAIIAATILNSPRAIETSLYVVRAFVRECQKPLPTLARSGCLWRNCSAEDAAAAKKPAAKGSLRWPR
jgi:hypothetical protein